MKLSSVRVTGSCWLQGTSGVRATRRQLTQASTQVKPRTRQRQRDTRLRVVTVVGDGATIIVPTSLCLPSHPGSTGPKPRHAYRMQGVWSSRGLVNVGATM